MDKRGYPEKQDKERSSKNEPIEQTDRESQIGGTVSRRDLLSYLSKMGAGALVAGLLSDAASTLVSGADNVAGLPEKRKHRYGMAIDTRRCVGCKACVVACKAENKTPPGVFNNIVLDDPERNSANDKPMFVSRPCLHCENPPCVPACPVEGATFKRESDGIVVVNHDICEGFGDCVAACPYGARTLDPGTNYPAVSEKTAYAVIPSPEYNQFRPREGTRSTKDKVRKCTFCLHLQDRDGRYDRSAGRWPACAKTCTGHAIHFGDFMDPASEVSKLLNERKAFRLKETLKTEPNIYYLT